METHLSSSEAETIKIAGQLARNAPEGSFICLYGDLGSGKTVFSKGFGAALGLSKKDIKSPTYTFVKQHNIAVPQRSGGTMTLYHFDFYRIETFDDLMKHDLEEIFNKHARAKRVQQKIWILIEWPEKIEKILPQKRTNIKMTYVDETTRKIEITENDHE